MHKKRKLIKVFQRIDARVDVDDSSHVAGIEVYVWWCRIFLLMFASSDYGTIVTHHCVCGFLRSLLNKGPSNELSQIK